MYKIEIQKRNQSKPEILGLKAQEWTDSFLEKRKQNPKHKHSWIQNRINYHPEFYNALGEITAFHCSYCDEFPIDQRVKQIDHFKPVSSFLHLVYEWSNLYMSCVGCNTSKLAQYNDLLLRPDAEDYVANDYFLFDTMTGIIEINETKGKEYVERAMETIKIFDLNNPSIVEKRLKAVNNYLRDKRLGESLLDIDSYDYRNFIAELL
jgi:uncharacterized protein (TIGR02646 family)